MNETVSTRRFDLDNYKNALIFDDKIIVSNNFYQSPEHFLYRKKNSRKDKVILKADIRKVTYNSIGNTISIQSKRKKRKLVFHSNESRNDFVNALQLDAFLDKREVDAVPAAKIASVLFVFTVLMVILFYYANLQKIVSMGRFLFLVLGFVIAMYTLFKKILKSVNITFSK